MGQEQHEAFVLWAVGIGDPCVRSDVFQYWRGNVEVQSEQVAELIAAIAAGLPENDRWRSLGPEQAGSFTRWWDDCYPSDSGEEWGGQLVPVPTVEEATIIEWALGQPQFESGSIPHSWTIDQVEWAIKLLLARFRALEPGVDVREFALDCAEGAWALKS